MLLRRAGLTASDGLSCVVKHNAVQYRSLRWEKSHEIVIKMLRVEKLELTPLSERICRLKLVRASIDSSEKRITN